MTGVSVAAGKESVWGARKNMGGVALPISKRSKEWFERVKLNV
jgi:hypothetical protein